MRVLRSRSSRIGIKKRKPTLHYGTRDYKNLMIFVERKAQTNIITSILRAIRVGPRCETERGDMKFKYVPQETDFDEIGIEIRIVHCRARGRRVLRLKYVVETVRRGFAFATLCFGSSTLHLPRSLYFGLRGINMETLSPSTLAKCGSEAADGRCRQCYDDV
ncbi:hypothetical protein EVAR_77901_1 [Eumeta japonica]|uniref:Uncharacterized protein n=1 Tax=Eumeta variegata TaxID=151549 RepID=A0A4C1ZGQ9_EUMVA|nr:hypothetical protein EVAR_77901_1 [Eumeta japonica]